VVIGKGNVTRDFLTTEDKEDTEKSRESVGVCGCVWVRGWEMRETSGRRPAAPQARGNEGKR
jgi:hypothetical protein